VSGATGLENRPDRAYLGEAARFECHLNILECASRSSFVRSVKKPVVNHQSSKFRDISRVSKPYGSAMRRQPDEIIVGESGSPNI